MKPHIVVGGGLHPDGLKLMEAEARVTLVSDSETEAGMVAAAKDAAGILFRSKPLCSRSLIAALPNLKVIGRHGVGLDIVDLPAATELGIPVVQLAIFVVAAIVVGVLAAVFPARRAARLDVLDAIATE